MSNVLYSCIVACYSIAGPVPFTCRARGFEEMESLQATPSAIRRFSSLCPSAWWTPHVLAVCQTPLFFKGKAQNCREIVEVLGPPRGHHERAAKLSFLAAACDCCCHPWGMPPAISSRNIFFFLHVLI